MRRRIVTKFNEFQTARGVLTGTYMETRVEAPQHARVVQLDGTWVVRVERQDGKAQVYRCTSEEQARQLLQVLSPAPAN